MARADAVDEREEAQFAADAPVVAAPRFFELVLIGFEFRLRLEQRSVHPLELRILLAAAPVSPGDAHELERRDLAGVVHVTAAAEVGEVGVRALRDVALLEVGEEVELEGLIRPLTLSLRLGERRHHEGMLSGDGLPHPVIQPLQVVLAQWTRQAEVVVEAGFDGRPDAQLGFGHEFDHGLGEDVGGRVAHARKALFLGQGREINMGLRHDCKLRGEWRARWNESRPRPAA